MPRTCARMHSTVGWLPPMYKPLLPDPHPTHPPPVTNHNPPPSDPRHGVKHLVTNTHFLTSCTCCSASACCPQVERELAIARAMSTSSSGRITPGLDGAVGSGTFASKDSGPLNSRDSA
jgi:hypothetical protein